jgi:hypothetical protein
VYWKGIEPSELLDYESRLVAFMQELPFQEGKPLSPITEEGDGSTELLEYSHTANNLSVIKSTWPPFAMRMTTSWVSSMMTSNSHTSLPMSPQLTPPG